MSPKLSPQAVGPQAARQRTCSAVRGERRGDLLGAQPGPGPADRGGQPSSACKFVLVGLANRAGPDGSCALPAARTLMRYTGLSERTVRAYLSRLEAADLIRPCDPAVVAADQAS